MRSYRPRTSVSTSSSSPQGRLVQSCAPRRPSGAALRTFSPCGAPYRSSGVSSKVRLVQSMAALQACVAFGQAARDVDMAENLAHKPGAIDGRKAAGGAANLHKLSSWRLARGHQHGKTGPPRRRWQMVHAWHIARSSKWPRGRTRQ